MEQKNIFTQFENLQEENRMQVRPPQRPARKRSKADDYLEQELAENSANRKIRDADVSNDAIHI